MRKTLSNLSLSIAVCFRQLNDLQVVQSESTPPLFATLAFPTIAKLGGGDTQ
uniref:Uncharacterized protein n=1 Tax=Anguilla anguilla TaxID=7936 RepID=A0A0E9WRS3_ANGAN